MPSPSPQRCHSPRCARARPRLGAPPKVSPAPTLALPAFIARVVVRRERLARRACRANRIGEMRAPALALCAIVACNAWLFGLDTNLCAAARAGEEVRPLGGPSCPASLPKGVVARPAEFGATLFSHNPKTGGTTLAAILKRACAAPPALEHERAECRAAAATERKEPGIASTLAGGGKSTAESILAMHYGTAASSDKQEGLEQWLAATAKSSSGDAADSRGSGPRLIYGHLVTRDFRAAMDRSSIPVHAPDMGGEARESQMQDRKRHLYVVTLRDPGSWMVSYYEELLLHERAAHLKAIPSPTAHQRALADSMCKTCVDRDLRLSLALSRNASEANLATLAHEMCLAYANRVLDDDIVQALCAQVPRKSARAEYNSTTGLLIPLTPEDAAAAKLSAAEFAQAAKSGGREAAVGGAQAISLAQDALDKDCNMIVLINERWDDSLRLLGHVLGDEICLPVECWDSSMRRNQLSTGEGRDGGYRKKSIASSAVGFELLSALGPTILAPLYAVYNAASAKFEKHIEHLVG